MKGQSRPTIQRGQDPSLSTATMKEIGIMGFLVKNGSGVLESLGPVGREKASGRNKGVEGILV